MLKHKSIDTNDLQQKGDGYEFSKRKRLPSDDSTVKKPSWSKIIIYIIDKMVTFKH